MKEQYIELELELIEFETEDIIRTSNELEGEHMYFDNYPSNNN